MKRIVHQYLTLGLAVMGAVGGGCGESTTNAPAAGPQHIQTVFVILMENKNWSEIKGNASAPYINDTLLPASSYTENYRGPNQGNLHPSEPNYIWMAAGENFGVLDDDDPPPHAGRGVPEAAEALRAPVRQGARHGAHREDPGDRRPQHRALRPARR